MKRALFRASTFALLLSVLVFPTVAREASPLLPPLSPDAAGRLEIRRGETVPAKFAVAFAAAAQATHTNPAFLFALAARSKYAANAYGANAGTDPDAPVGGPYAYGSANWLRDLALYGAEAGYPELATAVTRLPSGAFAITDPALRLRAMTARTNPYLSSFLAARAWQKARKELGALRMTSYGLVMIAFLGDVHYAEKLAKQCDKDRAEPLEMAVSSARDVLLIMTGLPARDARTGGEWTIGNFIDEVTNLLRSETSAYSAAKRINVPNNYRPRKPEG